MFFLEILCTFLMIFTFWILIPMNNGISIKDYFIFNKWRAFPNKKPPRNDWYLCTVKNKNGLIFPMILYWDGAKFVDASRQSIFHQYNVMVKKNWDESQHTDAIMPNDYDYERITSDDNCDVTDLVTAWKKEPKLYKEKEYIISSNEYRTLDLREKEIKSIAYKDDNKKTFLF